MIGVAGGGFLADRLRLRFTTGRLMLGYVAVLGAVPAILWMIYTESLVVAFIASFLFSVPNGFWAGIAPSTSSDLVMPRMRAIAGAFYILLMTFIGLALGPYTIGKLSDLFIAQGMSDAEGLRLALATSLLVFIPSVYCLVQAQRHLPRDEASRLDRARALGEEVPETAAAG